MVCLCSFHIHCLLVSYRFLGLKVWGQGKMAQRDLPHLTLHVFGVLCNVSAPWVF